MCVTHMFVKLNFVRKAHMSIHHDPANREPPWRTLARSRRPIQAAAEEVLDHGGETPAALIVIGYAAGLSNDMLRRIVGLSHPGAVRLVDKLVSDGLVERGPGRDGRQVALQLTKRGRRVGLSCSHVA